MKQLTAIADFSLPGRHIACGECIDIDDSTADDLIAMGRAIVAIQDDYSAPQTKKGKK